jgi:hypothetical protein
VLLKLLNSNRNELIERCRAKLASRFEPDTVPQVIDHGIPLFLQQLADILARERLTIARPAMDAELLLTSTDIGRAAAINGVQLLRRGYTVDQVVHYYGDVCQSVAELAIEQHASISADQFRTLNRCLDEAIADAVSAFANDREAGRIAQAQLLHQKIGLFADRQRQLISLAIDTFAGLKTGRLGVTGATGTALVNLLYELRDEADRTLPELRLASGMTNQPAVDTAVHQPAPPVVERRHFER